MTKAILIFLLSATLLMIPVSSGVVVTADSVRYISAAKNLVAGKGYIDYGGKSCAAFTPGYSMALATVFKVLGGVSRDQAVVFVNWSSLFCIGLFSWLILRRLGAGKWSWPGAATIMVSPMIIYSTQAALSECLFMAIALPWAYYLMRHKEDGYFAVAAILGVMVCLTRHAGAGLLIGSFFAMPRGWRRWLVTAPGILAVLGWVVFAGMGENKPTPHSPWSDLIEMVSGYWTWLGFLIPLAVVTLWKKSRLLLASAVGWAVAMFVICIAIDLGDPATRMLTPAVVLMLLGIFSVRGKTQRWMAALAMVSMAIGGYQAIAHTKYEQRIGYNTVVWKASNTMLQLKDLPDSVLFSNSPDGIWYNTGRLTQPLPRLDNHTPQLANPRPMTGECMVVFFKSQMGRYYYGDPTRFKDRTMADSTGKQMVYDMGDAWVVHLGAE